MEAMEDKATPLKDFIRQMPKVELHAHINGSISKETISRLIQERSEHEGPQKVEEWKTKLKLMMGDRKAGLELEICFDIFGLIHQLCDNTEAAYQITKDVITEFAADNVKYIELRTTPRDVPSTGMTKVTYVENVLRAINDCHDQNLDIMVRLLLAIDRGRHTEEGAMEIVKIADEFRQKSGGIVLGIDLSGNPEKNDAQMYLPALQEARKRGLKLALHVAEIPGQNEESAALLQLPPDRVGHGTYLLPKKGGNDIIMKLLEEHKTPIETCLTSNLCLQTVKCYSDHHFGYFYKSGHPCIICTDDKGVFNTTLSQEYEHAASAFSLSKDSLWQLTFTAIDYIFDSEKMKKELRTRWSSWYEQMNKNSV